MSSRPLLFLFGPTAVGKTSVIASLPAGTVEVINADSMQVYRGMDVGTAKPHTALRARVPHHLLDIRNPDQKYDVGAFVSDANAAMEDVYGRGRLPIVSGGTGYYFKHLLYGLPATPPSDPGVRERVRRREAQQGLTALYRELQAVDRVTADRIGPHDAYRITRALEVWEQTGRPLSSFHAVSAPRTDVAVRSFRLKRDREELRERVRARVGEMFASGLRSEVESLVAAGYGPGDPGMRAIGYREFFTDHGELRSAREDGQIALEIEGNTRRYAKRQATFFRRLPDVTTLTMSASVASEGSDEAVRVISEWVGERLPELDSP